MLETIRQKLQDGLQADMLNLRNDSKAHEGHAGNPGGEVTHLGIEVVSAQFEGKNRIARHRLVHACLKEELAGPLHAITELKCYTLGRVSAVSR